MDRRLISIPVVIALGACAAGVSNIEIRAIPGSPAQAAQPVPEPIAAARAQLALGNVALALEMFRKAEREMPGNGEALAGMAECYERMSRYDLSRRYLERALAGSPDDAGLLHALAAVLERQGLHGQAAATRAEATDRISPASSVTVILPAARPADDERAESELIPPTPQEALPTGHQQAASAASSGDILPPVRLERIGPTEVALVTSGRSLWTRRLDAPSFRHASGEPVVTIRLLNAARRQGLAAHTRARLQQRGWKAIRIGDASRVRERSLILFSNENREAAQRLAKQLGLALARDPRPGNVTVLLGRDAQPPARGRAT